MTRQERSAATRSAIVDAASALVNRRGFAGASISEVLAATGLEKGGLYNHFASKEDLAVAGFERSIERLQTFFAKEMDGVASGLPFLRAFVAAFGNHARRPVIAGGCPIANTAVDADDGNPMLRERVVAAVDRIRDRLARHAAKALATGQLRAGDANEIADFIFASVEGAAVLARVVRSHALVDGCVASLQRYLDMLQGEAHAG
jgi:TetR/AcrR family transcriptional repressor of nem operon